MEKSREQLNAEADVVKITTTNPKECVIDTSVQHMTSYYQQAIPKTIKFSSRASVNVKDNWYTIEYRRRKADR